MDLLSVVVVVCATLSCIRSRVYGFAYADHKALSDSLLSSTRYRTDLRPQLNSSTPITVLANFKPVSIVEVNDVTQSLVCNGFLVLTWKDELLTWNASDYGGIERLHPHPIEIWRPRLVLMNTLNKRDLFEDDASAVIIMPEGGTTWVPGGLFKTSCDLNLLKYPFDEQECSIRMMPMSYDTEELVFQAGTSKLEFYSPNGEWDLKETSIVVSSTLVETTTMSSFEVKFKLSRRPTFFVLNILLPVVLLSLLNMLVFTIPVDSGEKVSYGITVVLAMSLFLSIVSGMLPRSSDTVPLVTIYLFILMVVSVLTVIDAIVIVFLYHREEKENESLKITRQYTNATHKISAMRRAVDAMRLSQKVAPLSRKTLMKMGMNNDHKVIKVDDDKANTGTQFQMDSEKGKLDDFVCEPLVEGPKTNKYKLIGRHIDCVSFIVFMLIWVIVTLWFFGSVRS